MAFELPHLPMYALGIYRYARWKFITQNIITHILLTLNAATAGTDMEGKTIDNITKPRYEKYRC
jgi:hypothetical protein